MTPSHLLVLGDSLAFHGPERTEVPDDPRLYPQVAAASLGADVDLVARAGWTSRDAWWALTKDPVVWGRYLPRATGLLIAVGGMDQLPAAVPTWLRESVPYVRPGRLRRQVRRALLAASPRIIAASDGRFRQVPQRVTDHYLGRIVQAVRIVRPGLPIVALGPSPWTPVVYPSLRPHTAAVTAAREWGRRHAVPVVDLDDLVDPAVGNPDGLHWSWATHARVGAAVADAFGQDGWP